MKIEGKKESSSRFRERLPSKVSPSYGSMVFLHRRGGENGKRWMNSERKICVKFGDILGLLFEGNTDSIIPPGVGMWQLTDILAPQINFFTISSKVFLLYPDFSYRLTQILSTYLSRNILEEYFRFKKEHTPNTFIFKINTIISKLLSLVSLSFDRKNIRSESSRTVHTRNIYIYLSLAKIDRSLSAGLREFFEARCW